MADATEKLQKLESAVDKLWEMREVPIHQPRYTLLEAQHGEGSKIQIPKTVPLSELPIVVGDSQIKHLLEQFSMIKMNESWGTTGCATVFVEVEEGVTVLHKITNEIDNLNTDYDSNIPVIFMSSLTADPHTKKILEDDSSNVDFHSVCQIKYPSILADDFVPCHSKDGWYSPGDAFTSMWTSATIEFLLTRARKYAFISNADNLGAVVDLRILNHVIQNKIDYCMEVADDALDPALNSSNLWVNVKALKKLLEAEALKLEIIPKLKRVDGDTILQLQTEVGSAIKFFSNTIILKVPRSRFQKLTLLDQDNTLPPDLATLSGDIVEQLEVKEKDFVNILASDIFTSKKEMEEEIGVSIGYMENREDITKELRERLVDWVIKFHDELGLMDESLHLTIQIIDRFIALHQPLQENLRVVGAAALSLASKYEEVKPFNIGSLITDKESYTLEEVISQELLIACTLNFEFCFPTPYMFMRLYCHATNSEIGIEPLSLFFIELCFPEFEMVECRPSMLAASAMYTAQCTMNQSKDAITLADLSTVTGYTEGAIEELARKMVTLHQEIAKKSSSQGMRALYLKYMKVDQLYASRRTPAAFLFNKKRGREEGESD